MSDMTEREQDAAVIAAYDGAIEESARPNWTFAMGMEYANARNNRRNIYQCAAAMRRTIDRLQADNARLRTACEGVPEMMQDMIGYLRSDTGWMHRSYDQYAEEIVTKVATLRAILDGAK